MEIIVKKTVEEKVKISLPHYRKNDYTAYYVYSDERCINVCNFSGYLEIQEANSSLAFHLDEVKECTREEFLEIYNEVSEKLKSKIMEP
jgi:hypothetical protein